jgi:predicted dehydrogenase
MKPDNYFDVAWRREKGAGPVLINLIHDVDAFRFLCGEVIAVQAMESNAHRGHSVEDTAAILLRFANGAIGSLDVSDSIVAPWSWELTSGENPVYPQQQDQFCYLIGGSHGSLTIPQLEVWENPGRRSWYEPLARDRAPYDFEDPLQVQVRHFCDVILGLAPPMVPAREGLNTLRVVEAVKESARTGATVHIL